MKKTASTLLIMVLVALFMLQLVPMTAFAQQNSDVEYGTVTADNVNLRTKPDTSSEIIAQLPLYTRLQIISYDDNWYMVVYNENVGYVRADMLFVNTMGTRTAYVTKDEVNLRGGPGTSSYVITTLCAGQAIKVKKLIGRWYYAIAGDEAGYVNADFLTVSKPGSTSLEHLLKINMSGTEVERLQKELYNRGFLSIIDVTGYFGTKTREAVAQFQDACGLISDGIAGDATIDELYDPTNTVTHENAMFNKVKGTVEMMDWFDVGSTWLNKGAYFTVTDVKTGLSFRVRRFGGWFHADCEPVTAEDTAVMKRISGGSWSWNRRAIWVTYKGRTIAASMHTMPHMANPTRSNNFDGHFCIHMLNSKVHETGRPCPRHQACVRAAYEAGKR